MGTIVRILNESQLYNYSLNGLSDKIRQYSSKYIAGNMSKELIFTSLRSDIIDYINSFNNLKLIEYSLDDVVKNLFIDHICPNSWDKYYSKLANNDSERVSLNDSDKYEKIPVIHLSEDKYPIAFNKKVDELMTECGMELDEAKKAASEMAFELEIYYDKNNGLFAVESDVIESGLGICSPYTGVVCKSNDR